MRSPGFPSLGWEDLLEEGLATHSSILAWRIPWTEMPSGLWSMGLQRVGHNWSDLACTVNARIVNLQCVGFKYMATWFSSTHSFTHKHTHTHIFFFQTLFHYRLSQDTEHISLCYTVDICCLLILYIGVCIYNPKPLIYLFPTHQYPHWWI